MKEFINRNKGKILLIFCSFLSGVIGVSASIIIFSSEEVSYDNSKSGMSSSNVQDAIDELYGVARLSDRIDELEEELTATKTQLNNKVDDYWKTVYPVGSIYISVNSTSPQTKLGGTWVSFGSGRTIVGVNSSDTSFNTVEKTGGGKTTSYTPAGTVGNTTLTLNQIPSHNHSVVWGDENNPVSISSISGSTRTLNLTSYSWVNEGTDTRIKTANSGGGAAHNHGFTGTAANISTIQPYITVYMWKRTA